jgi:acetyl-CoA synthetase
MATLHAGAATSGLRAARDFLLNHREDYATAYRDYRPPALTEFNWALDWFDAIAVDGGDRPALWIVEPEGGETRRTFAELSSSSNQVANWLREHGVARGDRVIVMLGNQVELWETILAAMKLGAVIIPARRCSAPPICSTAWSAGTPVTSSCHRRRDQVRGRARRVHADRGRRARRRLAELRRFRRR